MSNEIKTRPLTPTEQKYTYAQSMQLEGQTGTIGHLRGDFATTGYGFYTTWFDTRPQWKSDEFKAELDTVINALREDKGLLHNRYDMSAFARHFPESAIKGNYCMEYGFRVDTEKHAFLLRCNPTKGDYNEGGSVRTTVGVELPWRQFAADRLATSHIISGCRGQIEMLLSYQPNERRS